MATPMLCEKYRNIGESNSSTEFQGYKLSLDLLYPFQKPEKQSFPVAMGEKTPGTSYCFKV